MACTLQLVAFFHVCFFQWTIFLSTSTLADDVCFPRKTVQKQFCRAVERYYGGYRTADGTCNNKEHPLWGAANTAFIRLLAEDSSLNQGAAYYDPLGIDTPLGHPLAPTPAVPTPHEVSINLFPVNVANHGNANQFSMLHMLWGQFSDHDMTLTAQDGKAECSKTPQCLNEVTDYQPPCFPILFPPGRPGPRCTPFVRNRMQCRTPYERMTRSPRTQINTLTIYIDGSMIYGNSYEAFEELVDTDETGKMRMGDSDLLPLDPEPEAVCKDRGGCFLAGDVRVDENNGLAAMHTIFNREHNRIATELKAINPRWSGKKLFYETRKILGAVIQKIMYKDYIPTLVDLKPYVKYDRTVKPSCTSSFATAAYRFGHTLIPNLWAHLNNNFDELIPPVPLRNLFLDNSRIFLYGVEPVLFGAMGNQSERFDRMFAESVSRRLFVPPAQDGYMDLTALNMQRARDHGVASYWHFRKFCGFGSSKSWDDPKLKEHIPNEEARLLLRALYKDITLVDLFAGAVCEEPLPTKAIGPTFACIIRDQFERLRDGDRFYYENPGVFTAAQVESINKMSLAKIMCNNMKGIVSLQRDVFRTVSSSDTRPECGSIPGLDLSLWKDCREQTGGMK